MLTWILIAFAIALIFGVIKIEQIKSIFSKVEPQLREYTKKAKNWSETKVAELKANDEKHKAENSETDTKN